MIFERIPNDRPMKGADFLMLPLDLLTGISLLLSGFSLLLLLLCYVYEVIMRYFFNAPTLWTYDISSWFLCTIIMLALPAVTRDKGNIAITFLLEKLPEAPQHLFERVLAFISFGVCAMCAWISTIETIRQYSQGIETLWNHPIPKWYITIVIPIGFLLSGCHFLVDSFASRSENTLQERRDNGLDS